MEQEQFGQAPEKSQAEKEENIFIATKEKWSQLLSKDGIGFMGLFADKGDELRSKYPDYRDYRMFHLLGGSTTYEWKYFDFPGEDSIEKFIDEEFEKEFGNQK